MEINDDRLLDYLWGPAPLLVLELGPTGNIVRGNEHAAKVLGDAIVGKNLMDAIVDFQGRIKLGDLVKDPHKLWPLDMTTASGEVVPYHFHFLRPAEKLLAIGGPNVEDVARMQREVLSLNVELSNLGRELQKANAQLKKLNALKNEFLGMAAHDLRKPVGVIMAYAGFLQEDLCEQLSEEQTGFLGAVADAATRMQRLIDDFLDVAMIESGRLELNISPAPLGSIAQGAVEIVEVIARTKQVPLDIEIRDEGTRVRVDCPKLEQVLINILGNAVEHSETGSPVSLAVEMAGENAVFRVTDRAEGIPPEKLTQLFQAFERAGTRKTAGERSHGLGLAIAKRIVEAHKGSINVESQLGEGSTFTVVIPGGNTG